MTDQDTLDGLLAEVARLSPIEAEKRHLWEAAKDEHEAVWHRVSLAKAAVRNFVEAKLNGVSPPRL